MFTEATLEMPEKKMSKKQKAQRTKSMVELDHLIRELEKIQSTTPLMFADQDASVNVAENASLNSADILSSHGQFSNVDSTGNNLPSSNDHHHHIDDEQHIPILNNTYEIQEPKFDHHYLVPTVSSSLPLYLQGETERIRTSFRSHTCWTIKKLPDTFMTGEVQRVRRQHTVENLVATSSNAFKPAALLKARDFDKPQYIGTDFEKMQNLNKIQVEQEKIRIDSYSRRPFVVSSRIRAKFEDIFNDDGYQFAYMGPGGNLVKLDKITRGSGSSSAGRSSGSGEDGSSSQGMTTGITPKSGGKYESDILMIKSWVTKIHTQVSKDWPMFSFRIRYTPTQEILIQFAYPKSSGQGATQTTDGSGIIPPFPPPNNALNKYMHRFASHGLASQFNLAKRGDRWHVVERDWGDSASSVTATTSTSSPRNPSHLDDNDDGRMHVAGGDTNNSSLTSSGSRPGSSSKGKHLVPSSSKLPQVQEERKQTVVLTNGGLLEEDPDGQRWFHPLPHYRHHEDEQPSADGSIERKEQYASRDDNVDDPSYLASINAKIKKSVSFSEFENSEDANDEDPSSPSTSSSYPAAVAAAAAAAAAIVGADQYDRDDNMQSQSQSQQKPALRRRLSSSMPQLETMLEETSSQLSSKNPSIANDSSSNHRSNQTGSGLPRSLENSGEGAGEAKYTDYLTFSFYTPWVSCRQTNTAKFYAQQDRFLAREKLRAREEKQAKLLAEVDAAIAENKARALRKQHHHHHGHGHRDSQLPPGIGGAHGYFGSISAMPSNSFSLTDTFVSGLNNSHHTPTASRQGSISSNVSSLASAVAQQQQGQGQGNRMSGASNSSFSTNSK